MLSLTINPQLLFVPDPFLQQLRSYHFEWTQPLPELPLQAQFPTSDWSPLPAEKLPYDFNLDNLVFDKFDQPTTDSDSDSAFDTSLALDATPPRIFTNEFFTMVSHGGAPCTHQRSGVPIVELRSERKRKSRTLIYLCSTARHLTGKPARIEIHSDKIESSLIGELQNKEGGHLVEIGEFMEIVVPPSIMVAMDQHKLTSSRFATNIVYLKIMISDQPTHHVHFYREKRMTRKRKLETETGH